MGSQSSLIVSFISPANSLGQRTYAVRMTGWQQRKRPHPHPPTWRLSLGAAPAPIPSEWMAALMHQWCPVTWCPLPYPESILTLQDTRIQRILSSAMHFGDIL